MAEKQPGAFDRAAFIAAVKEAIDAAAPKNLEEADEFKEGGAGEVKGQVGGHRQGGQGGLGEGHQGRDRRGAGRVEGQAQAGRADAAEEPAARRTPTVGAAGAMPPPVPAATTDLSAGPDAIDSKMADAEVTDEQIQKSNEPAFKGALDARDEAKEHADTAPGGLPQGRAGRARQGEGRRRRGSRRQGLQQMHGARGQALGAGARPQAGREDARTRPSGPRSPTDIQGIYDRTKADVTKTLDGLDGKVDAAFTRARGRRASASRTTSASAWTPTRTTATAASSAAAAGSRTSCWACRARSTPSTPRARPATWPTWTG